MLPTDIVRVLTHEKGLMKGPPAQTERSLFLNQADDVLLQERARQFLRGLEAEHPGFFSRTALGALQHRLIINR